MIMETDNLCNLQPFSTSFGTSKILILITVTENV